MKCSVIKTLTTKRWNSNFCVLMLAVILAGCGGIWIQPPRSLANIAALERVEVKSYVFEQAGGLDMEYGLFVPGNYQPDKPSPLVVALHGNGGGLMYMMEYNHLVELAENYGFLVVTPIGFSKTGWFGSEPIKHFTITAENKALDTETISRLSEIDVINVLNEVQRHYNIDESRIYLIGQSMGGGGVWYLGSKYSQIWAALAPLSPVTGEDPVILEAAKHLPVMVVAGDADIEMDIAITRLWVAKMDELGMQYEYLEIEAGTHSASGRENIGRVFEFLNEQHK